MTTPAEEKKWSDRIEKALAGLRQDAYRSIAAFVGADLPQPAPERVALGIADT